MSAFFKEDGQQALSAAIASLEEVSSAELVVVVRARSASYLHIDMAIGAVAAFACLAVLLYGPWPIAWHFLLLDPLAVGALTAAASAWLGPVQRLVGRRKTRRASVEQAAKVEFIDRGVHHTRERTGILIYVSMRERSCALVADAGVHLAIADRSWRAVCDQLQVRIEGGGDAAALAEELGKLAGLLAEHLPKRHDDIDELDNEVVQ